jgi:hypothetical protein
MRARTLAQIVAGSCTTTCSRTLAQTQSTHAANCGIQFLKRLPREWSVTLDHDCRTYEEKNIERLSKSSANSAAEFPEGLHRKTLRFHDNVCPALDRGARMRLHRRKKGPARPSRTSKGPRNVSTSWWVVFRITNLGFVGRSPGNRK